MSHLLSCSQPYCGGLLLSFYVVNTVVCHTCRVQVNEPFRCNQCDYVPCSNPAYQVYTWQTTPQQIPSTSNNLHPENQGQIPYTFETLGINYLGLANINPVQTPFTSNGLLPEDQSQIPNTSETLGINYLDLANINLAQTPSTSNHSQPEHQGRMPDVLDTLGFKPLWDSCFIPIKDREDFYFCFSCGKLYDLGCLREAHRTRCDGRLIPLPMGSSRYHMCSGFACPCGTNSVWGLHTVSTLYLNYDTVHYI
jgi:hypothetical protein